MKVAITGAAGHIGYALLFRIASGQMFGPEVEIEFNLLELPGALQALDGVVMELNDCAFPLLKGVKISSNPDEAFKEVDWALLVGSVPRKKGMERKDLLAINGEVFKIQGQSLNQHAKKTCKILVVGNPCNTNALIAKTFAPNIPSKNFFAMTMLDQNRAYAQLALKAKVGVSEVKNLAIWGNHSATQYPDFYQASIQEQSVLNIIQEEQWLQETFIKKVQRRGAEIIEARGFSSAASAANAIIDTVKQLTTATREDSFFSVAVSSDGSYGIDKGIMFSFPVRSNGEDWEIIKNIQHNSFALSKIKETYEELLLEKDEINHLFG